MFIWTMAVAFSGVSLNARFAISRPAFERLPDLGLSYEASAPGGLFEVVCCFEQTDFGYRFGVSAGATSVWGFAYSPDGAPSGPDIDFPWTKHLREGDNGYRHLDGPWYIWEFLFS